MTRRIQSCVDQGKEFLRWKEQKLRRPGKSLGSLKSQKKISVSGGEQERRRWKSQIIQGLQEEGNGSSFILEWRELLEILKYGPWHARCRVSMCSKGLALHRGSFCLCPQLLGSSLKALGMSWDEYFCLSGASRPCQMCMLTMGFGPGNTDFRKYWLHSWKNRRHKSGHNNAYVPMPQIKHWTPSLR